MKTVSNQSLFDFICFQNYYAFISLARPFFCQEKSHALLLHRE